MSNQTETFTNNRLIGSPITRVLKPLDLTNKIDWKSPVKQFVIIHLHFKMFELEMASHNFLIKSHSGIAISKLNRPNWKLVFLNYDLQLMQSSFLNRNRSHAILIEPYISTGSFGSELALPFTIACCCQRPVRSFLEASDQIVIVTFERGEINNNEIYKTNS